jgi:ATP-dependent DNA helicase RecG
MDLREPITNHFRVNDFQKTALKKLGVVTVRDVLYHFPARYITSTSEGVIDTAASGDMISIVGTISKTKARKAWKSRIPMTEATLKDDSGSLTLIWLHQPYISKMFPEGSLVAVTGKIKEKAGRRSMMNPEITHAKRGPVTGSGLFKVSRGLASGSPEAKPLGENGELLPVYPESRGVTSRWFLYAVQKFLTKEILESLVDPIPKEILKRYNLPALKTALVWMHSPQSEKDAIAARKRFAFEEVFFIQLAKQQERAHADTLPSWNIEVSKKDLDAFIKRFPFKHTQSIPF